MKTRRQRTQLGAPLCLIAILFGGVPEVVIAQSLASVGSMTATAPAAPATTSSEPVSGSLRLLVGRSAVLDVAGPIARVSLSKPEVADALVTSSQQLLVHGKTPGTISLMVWERSGVLRRYEVEVQRDITPLNEELARLFPGEPIAASVSGKRLVLAGVVSNSYTIEKAAAVAAGYVENAEDVVNLLRQQQGVASNQVLLRVRFAEVSRNALTELGASFFTGSGGYKDYVARSTTQQFAAPDFDTEKGGLVFTDYLNLLLFNAKHQLGAVIRALQAKGLFQTLAEPNLVAENGKEASFLAGGEYPYPVAQSTGTALAIAIHFKEFGIKLNFTPTIVGTDLIHLKVRPEVSSLDFANAVSLEGFRIPALTTRRTETEIELRDGQTFAIAGLLNNTVTSSLQKVPGIGDIPVLGLLFRSKAAQKAHTELVVMITPEILRRDAPGAAGGLPGLVEPFMPPSKVVPPPPAQLPGTPRGTEPRKEENEAEASSHDTNGEPGASSSDTKNEAKASSHDMTAVVSDAPMPASTPLMPAPDTKALVTSSTPAPPAAQEALAPATVTQSGTIVAPAPVTAPPPAPRTPATNASSGDVKTRLEAARRQRDAEIKAAAEERKQALKAQKAQLAREAEARRAAEKLRKQQEAEAKKAAAAEARRAAPARNDAKKEAKKAAEQAKKDAELAKKREQMLNEAEARLREAEAAYQAVLERASKGGKQPQ